MHPDVCSHVYSDEDQPTYCVTLLCVPFSCYTGCLFPGTQGRFLITCLEDPISPHTYVHVGGCMCVSRYEFLNVYTIVVVAVVFKSTDDQT